MVYKQTTKKGGDEICRVTVLAGVKYKVSPHP